MSGTEHLRFDARIRGIRDVDRNVHLAIAAVGLTAFRHRLAGKLSGGNQRKLSLGITIIGNPSILLLDEPSAGMDAVAKRVMWGVLHDIKIGRSLVITTHSMEEASALSDRVGILARRMLALGTAESLRRKHGDAYDVHLVHKPGGNMGEAQGRRIWDWVRREIPGAVVTDSATMVHGQLRFAVPKMMLRARESGGAREREREVNVAGLLLESLEEGKRQLGIEYYTFSETTLEDVFLNVVSKERVGEEDGVGK